MVHNADVVAWVDKNNIRSVLVQVIVLESGISCFDIVSVVQPY